MFGGGTFFPRPAAPAAAVPSRLPSSTRRPFRASWSCLWPCEIGRLVEVNAGERAEARGRGRRDVWLSERRKRGVREPILQCRRGRSWFCYASFLVPALHLLGAALLKVTRAAEAESVNKEDLRRNRGNGWTLFGLAQSLQAQGREAEAAEARRNYEKAWTGADVLLSVSAS
jgi:hypothetical protein